MEQNHAKLDKKDLRRMFFRMQGMNLTNNYESMQAVSFLTSITPALERIYKPEEEGKIKSAMKRHLQFFNSHVNGDAYILGITAAVEEKTSEEEKESVTAIKTGLMGPLAGLGDSLMKFTWFPICGSIGASLAMNGNPLGPILMFLMYNIVNQGLRWHGIHWGYHKGMEFLTSGKSSNIIARISNLANIVGLMVVGALISTSVKLKIPFEFTVGENVIGIQEMLNKVMPNFLPLVVTAGLYFFFKKSKGKHTVPVILAIMALTILLKYAGIL